MITARPPCQQPQPLRRVLLTILAGVATAILQLAAATPAEATPSSNSPNAVTIASCSAGIPAGDCQTAIYVYNFVVSHNFAAPAGLKGGSEYLNTTGLLPPPVTRYQEYRLYSDPGNEPRLVIDIGNTGSGSWYTGDHYASFVQFFILP